MPFLTRHTLRYNLHQLVVGPTHDGGNMLDLLIVPEQCLNLLTEVKIESRVFYRPLTCPVSYPSVKCDRQPLIHYSFCCIKQMDIAAFRRDMASHRCSTSHRLLYWLIRSSIYWKVKSRVSWHSCSTANESQLCRFSQLTLTVECRSDSKTYLSSFGTKISRNGIDCW